MTLTLLAAFGGGLLSFISPFVLPLLPAYVTWTAAEHPRRRALAFVAGLTIAFLMVGMAGPSLLSQSAAVGRAAGVIIIAFGLYATGVVRVTGHWATSIAAGFAFAIGWTPCLAPVLGGILAIPAATGAGTPEGLLLGAYSLGLGVPLVATTAFVKRSHRTLDIVCGALVIAIGVLVLADRLALVTNRL